MSFERWSVPIIQFCSLKNLPPSSPPMEQCGIVCCARPQSVVEWAKCRIKRVVEGRGTFETIHPLNGVVRRVCGSDVLESDREDLGLFFFF